MVVVSMQHLNSSRCVKVFGAFSTAASGSYQRDRCFDAGQQSACNDVGGKPGYRVGKILFTHEGEPVLSWATIEESTVVNQVTLADPDQGQHCEICDSERGFTFVSIDWRAQYAFFDLQHMSESIEEEDWIDLMQRVYVAVAISDLKSMAEAVRSIDDRKHGLGPECNGVSQRNRQTR